jgi:hypothetical protein
MPVTRERVPLRVDGVELGGDGAWTLRLGLSERFAWLHDRRLSAGSFEGFPRLTQLVRAPEPGPYDWRRDGL